MDKRPYTCYFTGHRNLPIGQEEEIREWLYYLSGAAAGGGGALFRCGQCARFRHAGGGKLSLLRKSQSEMSIILVQPFQGYQNRWTPAQQARAAAVEARVDKMVVCCQTPSREAFLARDRHMVDGSFFCIAWCACATTIWRYGLNPTVRAKTGLVGVERGAVRTTPCPKTSVSI